MVIGCTYDYGIVTGKTETIVETETITVTETETVTEEVHNGNTTRTTKKTKQMNGHMITAQIEFGHDQNITIRKSQLYVPPQKNVQAFASMHTYARRWLIGGLCGVAEAKDDDGNGAVQIDSHAELLRRAGK